MTSVASGSKVLRMNEADMQKMLACHVHIGTKNCSAGMRKYVYARNKDGVNIFDLHMTWEKIILAARILVAIENPQDIVACSTRMFGQRAVFKLGQHLGVNSLAGRFIPGSFTNQIQSKFLQPRVVLVTDPRTDHQALNEARLVNIPVIALCDTDSPMPFVDVAIPCNNRGRNSIAIVYWFIAREVLRMRGSIARSVPWEIKADLFVYRDPEEAAKREETAAITTKNEKAQDDNFQWGERGAAEENTWAD